MAKAQKVNPQEKEKEEKDIFNPLPKLEKKSANPPEAKKEKKVHRAYLFPESMDRNIAAEAYWSRKDKTRVLMEILTRHYQQHPQEPIPE